MNEWKALIARITLFPRPELSSPSEQSALDLYKQIWEGDPDNFRRSPNPLLPSQAQGNRADLTVACSSHPSRIDFNLRASEPVHQIAQPPLQLIENTTELHAEMKRIVSVLGKDCVKSSIFRVAIFVKFVTVKPSVEDANKTLISIIPEQYRLRITDEEDFMLQLNHSGPSANLKDIRMNLITKWSVDRIQVLTMSLPPVGGTTSALPGLGMAIADQFIAASLSLDANNVPDQALQTLTTEQRTSLLLDGLSWVATTQRDFGLNIKGF
jgi:hypothetical protein